MLLWNGFTYGFAYINLTALHDTDYSVLHYVLYMKYQETAMHAVRQTEESFIF